MAQVTPPDMPDKAGQMQFCPATIRPDGQDTTPKGVSVCPMSGHQIDGGSNV